MAVGNKSSQAKERYDKMALMLVKGQAGYIPAKKSRYSKSSKSKFNHAASFM